MKNWRFLTSISVYFENNTGYGHNYNGTRIVPFLTSNDP